MKDNNKRNQYMKIRVSQEEMDAIKQKFQNSGMDTQRFCQSDDFRGLHCSS